MRIGVAEASVQFEYGQESLLRHLHVADFLHFLLTTLLFFEQLTLTAHVAAVALGRHVFAQLLHRFAGDDFRADGRLDRNVKLLSGQEFFEFLAHAPTEMH